MKYNFNQPLKELDGRDVKNDKKESITIKDQCVFALTVHDPNIDGVERNQRGLLAETIYRSKESIAISIDELALLKKVTGAFLMNYGVTQVWRFLENPESGKSVPGSDAVEI